jgi:hypothetical protein
VVSFALLDIPSETIFLTSQAAMRRMSFTDATSALLVALGLAGCGSAGSAVSSVSPAPVVSVPSLSVSASTLTFALQMTGSASAAQTVTLTNSGSGAATIGSIAVTGTNATSFAQTNTCGGTVAAGANCVISVVFQPVVAGALAAAVSIADNAAGSPQVVTLAGTAALVIAPVVSLSAPTLTFTQLAETVSAAQTVTLSNSGNAVMSVNSIAVTGPNAWNFGQTNTCGATLAVGASCPISVTFNPSIATAFTAAVSIATNATTPRATVALAGTGTGTLSINTANPADWIITNGAITLQWNSSSGHVFSVKLVGYTEELVDTTSTSGGQPNGLYMDNAGTLSAGTTTSGYTQNGNASIDWWVTTASNATNAFTTTEHFIITANDTGFHAYTTAVHAASDITGSLGAYGGYTFRINQTDFTNYYLANEGLNNPAVQSIPLPALPVLNTLDPGRQVQNAVVDLHGLTVPTGYGRQFYTKYDYSSYSYNHKAHGLYGPTYAAWAVFPSPEWLPGGPTKQGLVYTGNILSTDGLTTHLNSQAIVYTVAQGTAGSRVFGPTYFHFNTFTAARTTPDALFQEAQTYVPVFNLIYDNDALLVAGGYAPSTKRGSVAPAIAGAGSSTANTAWTVLGDNAVNFQSTVYGNNYWVNDNATGTAGLSGVTPGIYRLSSYVLGQWGEHRQDNIAVSANQTTAVSGTFMPENFGTAVPVWTIGTPDRSAHEFLHGHDAAGNDLRNFYGAFNFWADFAATNGTQIYYATAVGSTPATNDLSKINYVQWGSFDPGLYGGVYDAADDTTDGYNSAIPAYVAALPGATGTNGVTTPLPPLTIHFTTNAAQQAQGSYAVLSVGVACASNDVFATLNGQKVLIWHAINTSDAMVRSGQAGFYQWIVFQWPTTALNAAGADNVLLIQSNQVQGMMLDALRMEITSKSASPAVTGWNDYEFLTGSTYMPANDAVPNN